MAGGIDWYRAHHGTVEDPKLGLIAQCAGQRRGDVIAMWHYLMEKASGAEDRGNPGAPHFRSLDFLLQLEAGGAERIYAEFVAEGLVDGSTGRLCAWDRRQPKREREDSTATDRQRAKRERDAVQVTNQVSVTPCHATSRQPQEDDDTSHQKTPRGEESREEEKNSSLRSEKAPRKRSTSQPAQVVSVEAMVAEGVDPAHARDWLKARGKHPVTPTAWDLLKDEADKAGITPARAVQICASKSWRGFDSTWDWPGKHAAGPPGRTTQPSKQTELESRNAATAARLSERFSEAT